MKHAYADSLVGDAGVAPRVGAWIETGYCEMLKKFLSGSPPAWGRGLKQHHDAE